MRFLILIYIANAIALLLHEIESAHAEEWKILKLPGRLPGFLIMHIPVIAVLLWGAVELGRGTRTGAIIAAVAGAGGLLPLFVHKILARRPGYFESPASNALIFVNALAGAATLAAAAAVYY